MAKKCKDCDVVLEPGVNCKLYDLKKSYFICIDCKRDYNRQTMIHSGGRKVTGLNKRPYPSACEMCGKKRKLSYHHFGNDLNVGVWICYHDHALAEAVDRFQEDIGVRLDKYLHLKEQLLNDKKGANKCQK